jgi:hypothetical protein
MSEEPTEQQQRLPFHDIELMRLDRSFEVSKLNARLEAVRMAQQTLLENARTRPAGEREITAEQIAEFALKLTTTIGA